MSLVKFKHLIILSFIVFGCSSPNIDAVNNVTITPSVLPEKTNAPIPTPTNTAVPSQTSTPVPTPSPAPTLAPEQADKFLKELLVENSKCDTPCFLGITPEQTTLEDINSLFIPLDPWYYCELGENKTGLCDASHRFDTGFSINIRLFIESGVVKNLKIINTPPKDQSRAARNEWLAIAPETMIEQYGTPSKINIFSDLGPTPTYAIDMYFDTYNIIYSFLSYDFGANQRICPTSNKIESVIIWMGKNPQDTPSKKTPLEEMSSLTKEEFSKLLTIDANGSCFIINK